MPLGCRGQPLLRRRIGQGRWVATDSIYGVGEVEKVLRRAGGGYVLGVTGTHHVRSWGKQPGWSGTAETLAASLPPSAYVRLSAGDGIKGLRQGSRMSLASDDPKHVAVVPGGPLAPAA